MSFPANNNAKINKQENQSKLTHVYDITIPYETFSKWAQENRESKNVKGFRQGHAPLSYFKDDWLLACVRSIADKIIKDENLKNIYDSTYVLRKFELGSDIEIKLNIELYPQIPEIDFETIKLTKHMGEIEAQNINDAIEDFKKRNFKPVNLSQMRAAQIDDFIKVSIEITDDQGKKEKMNEMQVHLGHNTFLPEIEQKFIGMNVNETLAHDFTIPETASIINDERLAGKQVKLLFEIKDIQGSREFSQEDIFEHFHVNSITQLEEKFKHEIEKNITKHSQFLLKETLKQELLKTFFEIPMQILQSKYIEIRKQMLSEIGYKEGEDEKTLVKEKMNLEIEEFDKRSLFIAEAIARLNFLISHFARKMQLEISNLELDDAIFEQKNAFPNGLQEAVKFFAENTKARENLTTRLMENKVLLMIASKCSLETKNHKLAEFYQINLQNSPQLEAINDISSSTESKESDDESSEKKVKSKGMNKKIEKTKENE